MRSLLLKSLLPVLLVQGACERDSKATTNPGSRSADSPIPFRRAEDSKGRFSLAGIDDPAEARRFLGFLQKVAADGDKRALVDAIRYPFTTWSMGKPERSYRTGVELEADLERVVTPKVLRAIRLATFDSLFVNRQGVMIGDGEVWFDKREDGIRIKAING